MNAPSPEQLAWARQVLAREAAFRSEPAEAVAEVYRKILLDLAPLIGTAGVHALLARSIRVTSALYSRFEQVRPSAPTGPDAEDPAQKLRECLQHQEPDKRQEAAEALLSNFFSLLAAFIGDRLTAQVLQGVWPDESEPGSTERKR